MNASYTDRRSTIRPSLFILLLLALPLLYSSSCENNEEAVDGNKVVKSPCFGDPYFHPQLARQRVSGIAGARYGQVRNGGSRWHRGVDLEIKDGRDLYAMYDGYIYQVGEMNGYGNYLIYLSRYNGDAIMIMYAHIARSRVSVGSFVKAGEVIATSGRTGNSEEAIVGDYVDPHVHVEVRLLEPGTPFLECESRDPEEYLGTELDAAGYPRNKRACHNEY